MMKLNGYHTVNIANEKERFVIYSSIYYSCIITSRVKTQICIDVYNIWLGLRINYFFGGICCP